MFATLAAAALPRVLADMAPVFQALHQWLDGWKGIGDLVTGMSRQGYGLSLTQYPDGWRCTFYTTGREHSLTTRTGSAWENTAALAVQRAAAHRGCRARGRSDQSVACASLREGTFPRWPCELCPRL